MSYSTRWLGCCLPFNNPHSFLWTAFKYYLFNLRPGHFRHTYRTSKFVRKEYDSLRGQQLAKLASTNWDSYISFPKGDMDFVLIGDRVIWGDLQVTQKPLLSRLTEIVSHYCSKGGTVIEFGSGDGRNLLFLKKCFPNLNFIGLELSSVSVELSYEATRKFGLDVNFYTCNVCEELPKLPPPRDVHLVFSLAALEQMPRLFPAAVKNMLASSSRSVVFLEPVIELYPWNLRGIVSRLRILYLDRLQGLMKELKRITAGTDWSLAEAHRLGYAANPINEICEIHLRHSGLFNES